MYLAPFGLLLLLFVRGDIGKQSTVTYGVAVNKWFIVLYALVAYYFANRMSRLLLLLGPVASVLAGEAAAAAISWVLEQIALLPTILAAVEETKAVEAAPAVAPTPVADADAKLAAAKKSGKAKREELGRAGSVAGGPIGALTSVWGTLRSGFLKAYSAPAARVVRLAVALGVVYVGSGSARAFYRASEGYAQAISQPSLVFKANLRDGRQVMVRHCRW